MALRLDIAEYDAVVSEIYDAALSPARWEVALTRLVNSFGQDRWDIAMLLWERVSPPAGRFVGNSGVNAMARHGYVNLFAGNNDWSVRGHDMPIGSVFHSDQLIERKSFRQTPFFTDFLVNFDLEVGLIALLDRHGGDHLCLCTPGPDNGRPKLLETALKLLVPHLQRAVRIARRLGEAELSARSARAALDRAPSAILMCDESLRVTYANGLGEELLRDGYLAMRDGRLMLADRVQTRRLGALAEPRAGPRCAAFLLDVPDKPGLAAMALRVEDQPSEPFNPDFGPVRIMIVAGVNHRASFAHVDHLRGLVRADSGGGASRRQSRRRWQPRGFRRHARGLDQRRAFPAARHLRQDRGQPHAQAGGQAARGAAPLAGGGRRVRTSQPARLTKKRRFPSNMHSAGRHCRAHYRCRWFVL